MAYTNIKKPSDYFNTKLYTGNGGTQSITGVGFQPDLLWFKNRDSAINHMWFDSVRGIDKYFYGNLTEAEGTSATILTAVGSDGFSVGANNNVNGSGNGIASWNWLGANGTSANTDGNVNTTISANPTAGFSIISANTGSTTGELTLGHGLNAIPSMFIWKNRDDSGQNWQVYHKSTGTGLMRLNDTGAVNTAVTFWNTPTTTLFKMTDNMYQQNKNFIGYCFADVQGYSKFGSYTGNGSTDGTFVYTGFKPAFVMIKSTATGVWRMWDNKRDVDNPNTANFQAQASDAEYNDPAVAIDFLSNGFKPRSTDSSYNGSGTSYIYMAFASEPLVGDNPATAR